MPRNWQLVQFHATAAFEEEPCRDELSLAAFDQHLMVRPELVSASVSKNWAETAERAAAQRLLLLPKSVQIGYKYK